MATMNMIQAINSALDVKLTDDPDTIALKIRRAKTDPLPLPDNLDDLNTRPEARNLVGIYAALADADHAAVAAIIALLLAVVFHQFNIIPKEDLGMFSRNEIVVDEMVTWFDMKSLEVLGRNYTLSYKAGFYSFEVSMEVEMTKIGDLTVPKILRYKGNWDAIFRKRERGIFSATLFDFKR